MGIILKIFYIFLSIAIIGGGFFLLTWNIPAPQELITKTIPLHPSKF